MNFPVGKIPRRTPGKVARTGTLNKVIDAVNRMNPPAETGLVTEPFQPPQMFEAVVWDAGPAGEADYTANDGRYWALTTSIASGLPRDAVLLNPAHFADAATTADKAFSLFTVTNLTEQRIGSTPRSLNKGDPIWVISLTDNGGTVRYVTFAEAGVGQYQFMVKQVVAQNQAGWDNTRAHPME